MDSLTQFVLGSAIGVAVLGRKTKIWKAALIGGIGGTLPDLDAFIDYGDPIRNMTYHRGESHAIFYHTLAAPILAWLITRLKNERTNFKPWLIASWLILTTHALIDLMTVYGTQIALPFVNKAYGISSIFIIDPLYTLPLLFCLLICGIIKSPIRYKWNYAGLIISTSYLLWSVAAQHHVKTLAQESLATYSIESNEILVTPTAFNTVLWRILVMTPDGYHEGFYSFLDDGRDIKFTPYKKNTNLYNQWENNWYVQRMEWFTNGLFKMDIKGDKIVLTDLRMGQEPYYSFNFVIGTNGDDPGTERLPTHFRERPEIKRVLQWVKQRMLGNPQSLADYLAS